MFEDSGLQRYDTAISQAITNISVKPAGSVGSRDLRNVVQSPMRQSMSQLRRRKKVKYTLVQALRLCTGRTAHRGSRGVALHIHDHGTRRG